MKKIIITVVIVALITFLAIFIVLRNTAGDTPTVVTSSELSSTNVLSGEISNSSGIEENTSNSDKKILYFYNDSFIGYLENNKWNKAEDLKLSEIFDNEYYTVYNSNHERSNAKRLQIAAWSGYGSFDYDGLNKAYSEDGLPIVDSPLAKYGTTNENNITILNLPVKLDDELANKYSKNLSDIEASSVKVLGDDFNYDESSNTTINLLSFNADYDVKFAEKMDTELPEDIKAYVDDLAVQKGLKSGVPYTLKEYYRHDLNNDGIEDEVFNIVSNDAYLLTNDDDSTYNTRLTEASKLIEEYGGFSAVITKINGEIKEIHGSYLSLEDIKNMDYAPIGSTEVFNLTVADLNEDNIYEIIVNLSGWEYWWTNLYTYNNGEYVGLNLK